MYFYLIHITTIMHALILIAFLNEGRAATMTSMQFSSQKACSDAASNWSMKTTKTHNGASAGFSAVCVTR